jgi:uncharacterized protein
MPKHKILYTADLHGNEVQYQKLLGYAQQISADCVIIGGDIAPKNLPMATFIAGQRRFLRDRLPQLLQPLKDKSPATKIFLMMGNDDCADNLDVLIDGEGDLYRVIHGERVPLTNRFDIVGYSFVPITPFGIKDWEKFDLSQPPASLAHSYAQRKWTNYNLDGFRSTPDGWQKFEFRLEMEAADSIQKDLSQQVYQQKPRETVYVIHTPPERTHLDQLANRNHVGSFALRLFIEQHQPYLTLHGHIHETVDVSGHFQARIGETVCMSPGNHNVGERVAVLVFDLDAPRSADRIFL